MQHSRPRDVVHVFTTAAQEAQILAPLDRAADENISRPRMRSD